MFTSSNDTKPDHWPHVLFPLITFYDIKTPWIESTSSSFVLQIVIEDIQEFRTCQHGSIIIKIKIPSTCDKPCSSTPHLIWSLQLPCHESFLLPKLFCSSPMIGWWGYGWACHVNQWTVPYVVIIGRQKRWRWRRNRNSQVQNLDNVLVKFRQLVAPHWSGGHG